MAKTSNQLLILSIVALTAGLAFVTGIINVQSAVVFYVALPLGAIFLGLFLIFRMFEKEASLYDQEQHTHPAFQASTVAQKKHSDCHCSTDAHRPTAAAR